MEKQMEIVVDEDEVLPIFEQLVQQIKQAVANEDITPGSPLPSIRQLANDLDLNSKTVAKAYKLLERDSVIESKGYRGSFIHPQAKENCLIDIKALVTSKLEETIKSLRNIGATDSEIRIAFNSMMANKA